jgi:hypothetical protein
MEPSQDNNSLPQVAMNINVPAADPKSELIKAEQIVGMCQQIAADIEAEKSEVTETLNNFAEMVFNAGDATSASKEALVNLFKLRSDLIDKKARLGEMMMKVFMKDGIKSVTAHQHNDIHITDKGKLIRELNNLDKENKVQ